LEQDDRALIIMGISQKHVDDVVVRLAGSRREIEAAQHLRYKVFYEEYGAVPSPEMKAACRDFDAYDDVADHLVVVDQNKTDPDQRIVGTYRLLQQAAADRIGRFYTSDEYDISPLTGCGTTLLELGRSCVLAEYRTRPVLQMLWEGITNYMLDNNTGLMFGCASLHGTDLTALAEQLSYLHHYHLAPSDLCPRALNGRYVDMNILPKDSIDARAAFSALPPLIKGYIRLGATIGDGAVVDRQFNTTDVCIVLPLSQVSARYRRHYARKINRAIPVAEDRPDSDGGAMIAAQTAL
jgi:putative hemolysin